MTRAAAAYASVTYFFCLYLIIHTYLCISIYIYNIKPYCYLLKKYYFYIIYVNTYYKNKMKYELYIHFVIVFDSYTHMHT